MLPPQPQLTATSNLGISRTYSYPLTPSPNSPFRAKQSTSRPKPYHRPQSDLQCHAPPHLGTATHLPISPTPTLEHRHHRKHHNNTFASALARSQSLLSGGLQQPARLMPQGFSGHQCTLQRADTAPALLPFALTSAFLPPQLQLQPDGLQASPQPMIYVDPPQQTAEPLVFPTEYIEERLALYLGSSSGADIPQSHEPYWPTESLSRQSTLIDTSSSALSDQSSFIASSISVSASYYPTPATSIGGYVSAYVPASSSFSVQCPLRSDSLASTVVGDDDTLSLLKPVAKQTPAERLAEEKRKQRHAAELIEMVIDSVHKIWPETIEPDAMYQVNPVRRNGDLRETSTTSSSSTYHQPLTPESSPTIGGKKRKYEEGEDSNAHILKKRSFVDGDAIKTLTIVPHPNSPPSADDTGDITLRKFVRELLRRSKTSCTTLEVALCYLDGIEDTVKKLKDCMKLGITFGTAAMAERGPYDEGMKDEGRIVKLQDLMKLDEQEEDVLADQQLLQDSWTPFSPELSAHQSPSQNQVLATHPLLDARRTFLASLVLATKFIQDKAYSNKAWAKLSGLGGKEVGRCERALGGALGWRLWVGKDCDGNSVLGRSRPSTPTVEVINPPSAVSVDSDDSPIHGDNDLMAEQFMAESNLMNELKEKAKLEGQLNLMGMGMQGLVAPAPQQAPAQVGIDNHLLVVAPTTRAAPCGRARTWPSLAVDTTLSNTFSLVNGSNCNSAPAGTTRFAHLSEALAVCDIQSALSTPCQSGNNAPTDCAWLDQILSSSALHHSPQPMEPPSYLDLSGVATVPATPMTVKITVDDTDGPCTSLATPYLSMAGSFSIPSHQNSPMDRFIEPWQNVPSYPFTFTAPQSIPQCHVLLHPQTAALRTGSSGGSSGSSTFSSPEVLTPVHSRSATLVDGTMDYQRKVGMDVFGGIDWLRAQGLDF